MFNNRQSDSSSEASANDDIVVIGQTNFRHQRQVFGIRPDGRLHIRDAKTKDEAPATQ